MVDGKDVQSKVRNYSNALGNQKDNNIQMKTFCNQMSTFVHISQTSFETNSHGGNRIVSITQGFKHIIANSKPKNSTSDFAVFGEPQHVASL